MNSVGRLSWWFAPVGAEVVPRRTRHTLGFTQLMPWPAVVLMEVSATDAMLYRYSADGTFAGDTWHEGEAAARGQAAWEYEGSIGTWEQVPVGVPDPTAFALSNVHTDLEM